MRDGQSLRANPTACQPACTDKSPPPHRGSAAWACLIRWCLAPDVGISKAWSHITSSPDRLPPTHEPVYAGNSGLSMSTIQPLALLESFVTFVRLPRAPSISSFRGGNIATIFCSKGSFIMSSEDGLISRTEKSSAARPRANPFRYQLEAPWVPEPRPSPSHKLQPHYAMSLTTVCSVLAKLGCPLSPHQLFIPNRALAVNVKRGVINEPVVPKETTSHI